VKEAGSWSLFALPGRWDGVRCRVLFYLEIRSSCREFVEKTRWMHMCFLCLSYQQHESRSVGWYPQPVEVSMIQVREDWEYWMTKFTQPFPHPIDAWQASQMSPPIQLWHRSYARGRFSRDIGPLLPNPSFSELDGSLPTSETHRILAENHTL